jgi:hypothetical protein
LTALCSKELVEKKRAALIAKLEQDAEWQALDSSAEPLLLQYNDPFVPPWKRRNEVAMPVIRRGTAASSPTAATASSGTQAPPPAKLELCNAKLEAAEVNARQWLNRPASSTAASASTGTQAPPPAKLELCNAKLEAAEVNAKQWGTAATGSGGDADDITLRSIDALDVAEFRAVEVRFVLLPRRRHRAQ